MEEKLSYKNFERLYTSREYIRMPQLADRHVYFMAGRKSFTGLWLASESGFLIARRKLQPEPYLFLEYHWDANDGYGTAKPFFDLGVLPHALREIVWESSVVRQGKESILLINYLDNTGIHESSLTTLLESI